MALMPLPATDSTRDLGMVTTAAGLDVKDDAAAADGAGGDPGVPVVVTVLYAPIPPGAAPATHAALVRLRKVAAAYPGHFTPLLGVCGRGDKRRLALVEGAWPTGRPLPEALPLLVLDADGVSIGSRCGAGLGLMGCISLTHSTPLPFSKPHTLPTGQQRAPAARGRIPAGGAEAGRGARVLARGGARPWGGAAGQRPARPADAVSHVLFVGGVECGGWDVWVGCVQ